ncbi:CBS domain-containing protein [Dethiobacter alkaliphilus]|uniref:CBS domain containing membrane protein n=1 Tax=Dethiobacter alkaliphilus AHT 1 TaxID=555088 RepID=C0GHE8_DETAL|nr:CBS domain-containing protein [Dethiobacter alkaliphilus]EEG77154.1 CBS domain containing membrane protein [Dethiobacter alkaliphilus AHT 1]MCW3489875.1 CBS domain-containing protein [Dethiobacter alkaliphilus]
MIIKESMNKDVINVEPHTTVPDALKLMQEKDIRHVPVLDNEHLVGMVSLLDVVGAAHTQATKVKDIMSEDVITVEADTPLDEAAAVMQKNKIGGLPVIQDGELIGMITETDLFKAMLIMFGVTRGGIRLTLEMPFQGGAIVEAHQTFRNFGVEVISLTVLPGNEEQNVVKSVWRLQGCDDLDSLLDYLREKGARVTHVSGHSECVEK